MAWGYATITNETVRCNACVILRETITHITTHYAQNIAFKSKNI